jgi:capsular exopolysaccharide synthesis family protein
MSKIEKALKKARAQDNGKAAEVVVKASDQDVLNVTVASPVVSASTELMVYPHDIARMAEPWQLSEADRAEGRIIYPEMEDHTVIDSFRTIRTKILQQAGPGKRIILVTSMAGKSGGSFVALNLAVAFTLDEKKTALLVDCNLRKGGSQTLVPSDANYGLTDYLEADDIEVEQIIHPVGIPRLRLIPAGRRSDMPTENLGSSKMKSLIAELRERYQDRYIILDTSSVTDAADARVLQEMADIALLVVPYGKTTEIQVWNAAKAIEPNKFFGVVFNDEPQLPKFSFA